MRKLTIFTAAVLALTAIFSGCNNEQYGKLAKNGISLTVKTSSPQVALRGPEPGEDIYNENLLNSIYYFFYPEGETTTAPVVKGAVTGISKTGSHTEQIPISANELNNVLFKNGNRNCELFVVANPPAEIISLLKGEPTLATLRAATFLSSLDGIQDDFVMVFDDTITVDSRFEETAVEIEADLSRLACKFTINADVASVITADGIPDTWTPAHTEGAMTVTFRNALNRTTLSGFDKSVTEDEDYFDATPVELKYDSTTDGIDHFKADLPIYSYPMAWEFTDKFEPMIMFDVKYNHNDGNGNIEEEHRYYKLMLGQKSITSNDWYVMTTQLSVIGSLLPDDPVVEIINIDYIVNDWKDAFTISVGPNTIADITSSNYLMVPQTIWNVMNEASVEIPFISSHKCKITINSATNTNYVGTTNLDKTEVKGWFDVQDDRLVFTHELHNTLDEHLDYVPYVINLTISQEEPGIAPPVNITVSQYPAIYIQNFENEGPAEGTEPQKGNVWVNGSQTSGSSGNWNYISNTSATGNNSSNLMTVINVSKFDVSSNYIIGDPRSLTEENPDFDGFVDAPALYDGNTYRKLKYYYPTVSDDSRSNFIAPKIRTCSGHASFGGNVSYELAVRRCAAYQEDGYPAGRWRLPTEAEFDFILFLSENSFIPAMFRGDQNYWFASGRYRNGVKTYGFTGTGNSNSVRCVYDEWYWETVDKELGYDTQVNEDKTFKWGDMPRNYTR